ncbi:MAG: zinc ribbon domain-containing protein, partial [Candidatus Aminicenantales bacterium]
KQKRLLHKDMAVFFFIGGIQPRTVRLDRQPRSCPVCGRPEVFRERVDHYLSLFFIPLFPVKKGTPFLACAGCGTAFDERGGVRGQEFRAREASCPFCGRHLEEDFDFCPRCGRRVTPS